MPAAHYEFRVSGRLSERAQHAFGEMQIVPTPPETIIYGAVADGSHLRGILDRLDNLGLHVVSVHRMPDVAPTPTDVSD